MANIEGISFNLVLKHLFAFSTFNIDTIIWWAKQNFYLDYLTRLTLNLNLMHIISTLTQYIYYCRWQTLITTSTLYMKHCLWSVSIDLIHSNRFCFKLHMQAANAKQMYFISFDQRRDVPRPYSNMQGHSEWFNR